MPNLFCKSDYYIFINFLGGKMVNSCLECFHTIVARDGGGWYFMGWN